MTYAIKLLITALLVVSAAEVAKRFPALGAVMIALPIASMIAMGMLYYDTQDAGRVAQFSRAIPPAILPSLIFFYAFSFLVESGAGFVMAMGLAALGMLGGYGLFLLLVRHWQ